MPDHRGRMREETSPDQSSRVFTCTENHVLSLCLFTVKTRTNFFAFSRGNSLALCAGPASVIVTIMSSIVLYSTSAIVVVTVWDLMGIANAKARERCPS